MDQLVRWSRRVRERRRGGRGGHRGVRVVHRGPAATRAHRDPGRRAGAALDRPSRGLPRKPLPPQADPRGGRAGRPSCFGRGAQPMIIAGGGAVDAQAELTALAEALGAPVATTVNGKGVVDEAHPLSVGASIRLRARAEGRRRQRRAAGGRHRARRLRPVGGPDSRPDRDPLRHRPRPAGQELPGRPRAARRRRDHTRRAVATALPAGSPATAQSGPRRCARPAARKPPGRGPLRRDQRRGARRAAGRRRAHRGQLAGHLLRLGALLRRARATPVLLLARLRHARLRPARRASAPRSHGRGHRSRCCSATAR